MSSFHSIPLYCSTCSEEGHHFSKCQENNNQTFSPDQERCEFCGKYGHNQNLCPELIPYNEPQLQSLDDHSSYFVQEPSCTNRTEHEKLNQNPHDHMTKIISMANTRY